jgi:hypothetical protein
MWLTHPHARRVCLCTSFQIRIAIGIMAGSLQGVWRAPRGCAADANSTSVAALEEWLTPLVSKTLFGAGVDVKTALLSPAQGAFTSSCQVASFVVRPKARDTWAHANARCVKGVRDAVQASVQAVYPLAKVEVGDDLLY